MPDERVAAAIAHWAPRFVANGVDFNDFQRVTAGVETWEEWLPAWVANGDMHAELAREAEDRGRSRTAGDAWNRAALSYHFGKFVWMLDLDRYREATGLAVEALRNAHRHLDPSAEHIAIPYGGGTMAANLRWPARRASADRGKASGETGRVPQLDEDRPPPLVLLLPGLDSTKEEFLAWEDVFLARGFATLSLDGPGQGETGLSTQIE